MTATTSSDREGLSHLFAGAGLGLLVGAIAGLSVSPVVSVILGSLAALLAAFLGVSEAEVAADESPDLARARAERRRMKGLRAGSFGIACVIGIAAGVYTRVAEVFAPSINEQIAGWVDAGYPPAQAREFTAFQRLGIKPKGVEVQFTEIQKRGVGGLFAGEAATDYCFELRVSGNRSDPDEALEAYAFQDSESIQALGEVIVGLDLDTAQLRGLLAATVEVLCEFEARP